MPGTSAEDWQARRTALRRWMLITAACVGTFVVFRLWVFSASTPIATWARAMAAPIVVVAAGGACWVCLARDVQPEWRKILCGAALGALAATFVIVSFWGELSLRLHNLRNGSGGFLPDWRSMPVLVPLIAVGPCAILGAKFVLARAIKSPVRRLSFLMTSLLLWLSLTWLFGTQVGQ